MQIEVIPLYSDDQSELKQIALQPNVIGIDKIEEPVERFSVFENYVAMSFSESGYIYVKDVANDMIVYELTETVSELRAGKKVLKLGSLLEQEGDAVSSFKLTYTTYINYDDVFNEVHFFPKDATDAWSIFENENLFTAGDKEHMVGINAQIQFTSRGTNLIFIDDTVDPPLMTTFV